MMYFKHYSNMRHDLKLKRVISRYGLEGYGLYCLIIESITESLSENSPMPDLHENCEDIAEFYNGNTAKINEMMNYMINQGLFDILDDGVIICHKVYKFLDSSQTRSEKLRNMIKSYKDKISLPSQTVSDKSDIEKEKEEDIEEELINIETPKKPKSSVLKKPSIEEIGEYCKERGNTVDPERFYHFYESKNWMIGKVKMKNWKSAVITWEKNDYKASQKNGDLDSFIDNMLGGKK